MTLEPGLKAALLRVSEGRNMNDTAVAALASHYGLDVEPTGLPPRPLSASDSVCWSMPAKLRDRITDDLTRENRKRRRRGEPKLTQGELVNRILREQVGASVAA